MQTMTHMEAATRTRLITIRNGEEAIITVDDGARHITLEFSGMILSVFEEKGVVYTRQEFNNSPRKNEKEDGDITSDEEDNFETQPITPLLKRRRRSSIQREILKNLPNKKLTKVDKEDLMDLQLELFGDCESGDTQIDV